MKDMFQLWSLADEDLLSTTARYTLADTGQGLNRVKPCPRVGRAMHSIIAQAMDRNGTWIGSSVVHLGDRTVPNALFFGQVSPSPTHLDPGIHCCQRN